jgi:glutamate synthase domain-containing protein 2
MRYLGFALSVVLFVVALLLATLAGGIGWIILAVVFAALAAVGARDMLQERHSILRNYPILGHFRFILEAVRPELQQYFIERNYDGRPFDRDTRTSIYERAKGIEDEQAYGTERDVGEPGYEWLRLTALNRGAAKGDFAHDTGEGGLSKYHLDGGDLVWKIGTGYFGARTKDGGFEPTSSATRPPRTRSRWSR